MAYVIAVCGSGGKTTLVKNLAKKYANENKKVCITTTTHMWYDDDVKKCFTLGANIKVAGEKAIKPGKINYIANLNIEKELITPLESNDYRSICDKFDYVIVEADGSRSMPLKIPKQDKEPVIPHDVNEIIIVVGMESVGREIGAVCHRFDEFYGNDNYLDENNIRPETIVSEELIDGFVEHYYYEPLKKQHSEAKITVYKNYFNNNVNHVVAKINKIAIVLLAAGFSKRFGSNKLMIDEKEYISDKNINKLKHSYKLYELMIDKLIDAKNIIINNFKNNKDYRDLQVDIIVVSQYEEILNDKNYNDKVIMLNNTKAVLGMSESIKLAINYYRDSINNDELDAMVFVNADMPYLPASELASFVYNSILNKNSISAMCSDEVKNPAYFEKEYFDEILKINGDKGPRELLEKYFKYLYRYYISEKYLIDIDENGK